LRGGAILDINADGALEFVFCTQPGRLFVVNEAGEFIYDYLFAHRTINVTPTFGEMSKKTPGLEMVITGGEAGLTHCFSTPAQADGLNQWIAYHADSEKTAAWFGLTQGDTLRMSPKNLAWNQVVAGEPIVFEISLPEHPEAPMKASSVCLRPDGARETAFAPVVGKTGLLQMPVNATVPGVYHFSWTLQDAEDTVVFSGEKALTIKPLANESALLNKALSALNSTADALKEALPATERALRRESILLEAAMKQCMSKAEGLPQMAPGEATAFTDELGALVAKARHLTAITEVLEQAAALGATTSLLAFEGPMWECVDIARLLPEQAATELSLNRTVVPGEHEPVSLKLFNITDQEIQVRVRWKTEAESIVVTPLQSRPSPTSKGGISWDPMPELGSADIITIPSLSTREIWLDLALGAIPAGDHNIAVTLEALDGAGVLGAPRIPRSVAPPTVTVDIALKVIPFDMAPPGAFRLCTWSRNDDAAVADMLAHGSNVFINSLPAPIYAEDGSISGLDMKDLNTFVKWFEGHDVFLLFSGAPRLKGKVGDDIFAQELAVYLKLLVAEMAEMGYDKDHFAVYSHDEPGGHGWHAVHAVIDFGKAIHAVDPDIMIYVNGGGEEPMFQAFAEVTGVWCPGINMLPEDSASMDIIRNNGKHLWTYNCSYSFSRPVGPNLKDINVVGEFRLAALFNFSYGATGMGYWSYNISEYPWGRIRDEYTLTYPGREQVVSSRRWEAVREGIEDCRIALALQQRLNDTAQPLPADLAARIRDLFDRQLPEHFEQSFTEMVKGLAPYALDRTNNDAVVQRFRDELIACASAVAQLDGKAK